MADRYVTFIERPIIGCPASFIYNGQTMTSSPVMSITPNPINPGILTIQTASGSRYTGSRQSSYSQSAYATQYGQPSPLPQAPFSGTYAHRGSSNMTVGNERILAALCHILSIFTWFIAPLVIYLVAGKDSSLVDHHAKEALNLQLTLFLASILLGPILGILVISIIGIILIPLLIPLGIVIIAFNINAAIKANAGEYYSYPIAIHFIH